MILSKLHSNRLSCLEGVVTLIHNVLQVVADQMELWQAQSQRLKTHTAQLYAKFESKEVFPRQLALIHFCPMGAWPLLACRIFDIA